LAGRQFRNVGTNSVFKGTIMADQSVTLNTGATLDGRALARIAGVTLAGQCDYQAAGGIVIAANSGWIDGAAGFGRWLDTTITLANAGTSPAQYS